MIVDTSVLIAILKEEPEAQTFLRRLSASVGRLRMSAGNYLETAIVVDANANPLLSRRFDDLLVDAGIVIEPITREQAEIARAAYRDFGKGSGSPAGLNFGDCFAYALARERREPMLFKGDDFSKTDIGSALT